MSRMANRKTSSTQETDEMSVAWNKLPWHKLEQHCFRIQKRIYRAKQNGNTRKVEKLQKLLMKSEAARLLAVRRVTQDNQGKKTAGVDGVKAVPPKERFVMAQHIHPKHWKHSKHPLPVRRVWIPKPGKPDERRPLGIPVMMERSKQALVKLALEPAWEAVFEPNSYGFRPGRSCHDAIGAIFLAIKSKPKFVFDADVKGAFDHISHNALLEKLHALPKIAHLVKGWLKAGVMEGLDFSPTESGTPQGGVISPLLMNVALHGMETAIREPTYQDGKPIVIRYADDFVLLHPNKDELQKAAALATEWLKGMGLGLSPNKTRVTHTLAPYEGNVGFDFLGYAIRQFQVGQTHTGKSTHGKPLGFKTIITPSQESIKRHTHQIGQVLRKQRNAPQQRVIRDLNPIIRGWCLYHRWVICTEAFTTCDHITFLQLCRWGNTRHPKKSKQWVKEKYFIRVDERNRFGTYFKDEEGETKPMYVVSHADTHHQDYILVKGNASPYDGNLLYWAKRLKQHPLVNNEKARLLQIQKGQCPRCGLYFGDGDLLEVDHIVPTALGGKDKRSNKWVYHRHCHDEKTAEDMARMAKYKAAGINHQ
jgi:RNA-directed DNA polymerase